MFVRQKKLIKNQLTFATFRGWKITGWSLCYKCCQRHTVLRYSRCFISFCYLLCAVIRSFFTTFLTLFSSEEICCFGFLFVESIGSLFAISYSSSLFLLNKPQNTLIVCLNFKNFHFIAIQYWLNLCGLSQANLCLLFLCVNYPNQTIKLSCLLIFLIRN